MSALHSSTNTNLWVINLGGATNSYLALCIRGYTSRGAGLS